MGKSASRGVTSGGDSGRGGGRKVYSVSSKDYELLEEVGYGASATVYRAIYLPRNEVVAIKSLDLDRCNSNLDDIRKEAHTMSLIDHPNVISAYCSFVVEHHLWVVMPFMAEGSCLHLMKISFPDGFEEPVICSVLKETLKALVYLHRHGHIHRDVKAGNILLDSTGIVKLGDFGVSACMFDNGDRQRSRNTFVGTPCWMAPEVLQPGSGYDFKADIWSFGITALELAHGHAPFSKYPPMKVLLMTIQNAPPGLDYDRDRKFSKSFKEMVAMCLVKDPTKRPTAEKLLKHSCFKNVKPPELSVRKVLVDLPPLWDRVKALQLQDAAQLALKKMPSAAEEALSMSQYQRGVSAWKFDIEDLKKQAALIQDDEDLPGTREINGNLKSNATEKDSLALISAPEKIVTKDESDNRYVANGAVTLENIASSGKDYVIEADVSDPIIQGRLNSFELEKLKNDAIPVSKKEAESSQSKNDTVMKPQAYSGQLLPANVFASLSSDKGQTSDRSDCESQLPPEKPKRDIRKAPNFSGPLMLPNRASANSLSAPTAPTRSSGGYRDEDKPKGNVVQIKGRFSVTSENVDLAKDISISTSARRASQDSSLRKSASAGDWQLDSKQSPINLCKEISNSPVPASVLVPHLQNLLHQSSFQQNLITNLLNSLQQPEQTYGTPSLASSSEDKIPADALPLEREQLLLIKISELQARMASLTDELTAAKVKQAQLQQQLKAAYCRQEDKSRKEEQEG